MRRVLPTLLALLLLGGLVWLFRVAQRYDPGAAGRAADTTAAGDINIRLDDAAIVARSAGRPQWSLQAHRVDLRRAPGGALEEIQAIDFAGIRNGVLYRNARPEARFSARRATFEQATQRFDVSGAVRFQSTRGDSLQAESLLWSERDDFVRFPLGGRAVFRGQRISAPVLLYAPRKRLVQCPQGARATFRDGPVQATSLFWDLDRETVALPGPVSGIRRGAHFSAESGMLDLHARSYHLNKPRLRLRIEGENAWEGVL